MSDRERESKRYKRKREEAYRFFHLDLVDLYSEELMSEVIVTREFVAILHIFALWDFGQDSGLSTSQGLQGSPQLTVLCTYAHKCMQTHTGYILATQLPLSNMASEFIHIHSRKNKKDFSL